MGHEFGQDHIKSLIKVNPKSPPTIHISQRSFVEGKQILDAILIANEVVGEKRCLGRDGVVFKINFEKT